MLEIIKILLIALYFYLIGYVLLNSLLKKPENKIGLYGYIGLAGILGIGTTSFELLFFYFLRIPWQPLVLAMPWLVLFIWLAVKKKVVPQISRPTIRNYLIVLLTLSITLLTVGWALTNPVFTCDGWAIWNLKAQVFYLQGTITNDFLLNHNLAFAHMDYVLLVSLSQTWIYLHLNNVQTGYSQIIFLIAYWSMLLISLDFFKSISKNKTIPIILTILLALTPWLIELTQYNYADVMLASYVLSGITLMIRWLREKNINYLYLFIVLFGFGAFTKNEGIVIYIVCLIFLYGHSLFSFRRLTDILHKTVLPIVLSLIAFFLWKQYTRSLGIFSDMPALNVNLGFTLANFDRLEIILKSLFHETIIHYAFWGYLWRLFIVLLVVALINKLESRKYYLIMLMIVAAYTAIYYYTVQDLVWHLRSSLDRLIVQIAPIAVLLSGFTVLELWDKTNSAE